MNWYYAEGNQQIGPVDQAEFDLLVASGRIQPTTLVWHAGMASWAPYSTVQPSPVRAEPGPAMGVGVEPVSGYSQSGSLHPGAMGTAPAYASPTRYCVECGTPHAEAEMVRFGDSFVCGNCKNVFAQKLREGVRTTATYRFAGFWIRFLAVFIDGILIGIVNLIITGVISAGATVGANPGEFSPARIGLILIAYLLNFVIASTYEAFFLVKYGATLGKMACGLRVIRASGAPITWGLAYGRYFSKLLSSLTFLIGYIIAAFDDQKRALHDRICDTRVIFK